jgi:alpha-N-arabinofuranosidase
VATHTDQATTLFAINRATDAPLTLRIDGHPARIIEATTLTDPDVYTRQAIPRPNPDFRHDPITIQLPPVSWNVITLA